MTPLDMPDGPGWWARDGLFPGIIQGSERMVCYFPQFSCQPDQVRYVWGESGRPTVVSVDRWQKLFGGRWYRLTMPWEAAWVVEVEGDG